MNFIKGACALLVLSCFIIGCDEKKEKISPLPFLWGTATAGFQVDMGCPGYDCSDPSSDWWVWVHDQGNITDGLTSGDLPEEGPGHWQLFEQDFDLAVGELGTNVYRFSLEWGRIFPNSTEDADTPQEVAALADQNALQHYHDMLGALRDRDIHPLVTLHHYTIPLWAHDPFEVWEELNETPYDPDPPYPRSHRKGWLEEEFIVSEFGKYARFVAEEFGGEVDLWITQNEPVVVVSTGFLLFRSGTFGGRTNPPGIFDVGMAMQAYHSMIRAHVAAYDAIKEADAIDADSDGNPCMVGVVLNLAPLDPRDPDNERDIEATMRADYFYNRMYMNAAKNGDYDMDFDLIAEEHREDSVDRVDFIGLNYYFSSEITALSGMLDPRFPLMNFAPTEVGIYSPEGFTDMIDLIESYDLPTIVTENGYGLVTHDVSPEEFIVQHLHFMLKARDEGKRLLGYCYWSLLDNLEWNEGWRIQMGLMQWDPVTKERSSKDYVPVYRRIIEENAVPEDLWEQYGL